MLLLPDGSNGGGGGSPGRSNSGAPLAAPGSVGGRSGSTASSSFTGIMGAETASDLVTHGASKRVGAPGTDLTIPGRWMTSRELFVTQGFPMYSDMPGYECSSFAKPRHTSPHTCKYQTRDYQSRVPFPLYQ